MTARRRAVVTGAASGIGRATALAFAEAGYDLAICDIDEERLSSVADEIRRHGVATTVDRVDVGDRQAMAAWSERLHADGGAYDVVVNNAGVAVAGPFVELPLDDFMWLLDINLRGVIYGCHFFIPPMVARGNGGHVVNISSVAGLVPFREMTAYNAAKFGVLGFSEALRQELSEHDIGVTTMCPGTVSTQIVQHSRAHGYDNPEALRSEGIRHFAEHGIAPERVAARIVRSVGTRGGVRLVGSDARLIFGLHRLLPSVVSGLANLLRRAALKRADPAASTTEESK